ncbi:MAG: Fic family protein [Acidimicrobiales bacterium]
MIFRSVVDDDDREVVGLIDELRERLRWQVTEPRRWVGSLRRLTIARAVQGSNSIEGYDAALDDVVAALEGEEPLDASVETRMALEGYRDAMTYVLQLAREPSVRVDESLIKSLHFMMLKHDLRRNPGRWRPGFVYVRREPDGEIVYEGPDAELVPALVDELLDDLREDGGPVLVRGAMAHLNLVMIHPFSDGNGRMARCLQTLVLAREKILPPEFNSIEEYLGRNAQSYYEVLADVGQGSWRPQDDAHPWIRYCLTAHYRQAHTLLRRVLESEQLWDALTRLVQRRNAPGRSVGALFEAALGFRVRNATYRAVVESSEGDPISEQTASRDLKALVEAGLLTSIGEKRGRVYVATGDVRNEQAAIRARRAPRQADDPYAQGAHRRQPRFAI